ncbi:hypothetical protein OS493_026820 [Desmophyllum pertusum]|uniref:Uncharacterized protein n=1 Tax=Desmophyllum pertusum TaxID=174260 RepID=A0A9W9ZPL1_9CNID|nr:hypothetical protein OS493_026820 [Desmophyllum pertusum]
MAAAFPAVKELPVTIATPKTRTETSAGVDLWEGLQQRQINDISSRARRRTLDSKVVIENRVKTR